MPLNSRKSLKSEGIQEVQYWVDGLQLLFLFFGADFREMVLFVPKHSGGQRSLRVHVLIKHFL